MNDWRAAHFGTPGKPPPTPARRRWWAWILLTVVLVGVGTITADRFGLITLPEGLRSTVERVPGMEPAHTSAGQTTVTGTSDERALRERVASRERGIALMNRERQGVVDDLVVQQRLLTEATTRLRNLESTSTTGMSPLALDQLRRAHADTVAAAKNATLRSKQLTDRRDSFDRRIATARSERDAALTALGEPPRADTAVAE